MKTEMYAIRIAEIVKNDPMQVKLSKTRLDELKAYIPAKYRAEITLKLVKSFM